MKGIISEKGGKNGNTNCYSYQCNVATCGVVLLG